MVKKIKFFALLAMLFVALGVNAQVTTSAISGVVKDADETLIGATVQAVHVPSGTKYNALSNIDGRFTMQGMRTGGPYKVTVTYVGYETKVYEGIYLQLGNTYVLNPEMQVSSNVMDEVVVTAQGRAQQAGASHNFSSADISTAPTVDRNIYDVVKNSPMVFTSKVGGLTFAGTNNRYNSFQIDGTVSNDVFGLASSGTNGGQASANPISLDAVQEIQVVVAPFDVRQSGFTGGGINAITKQGTNDFHATFYTYYNNENFYGRYDATQDYAKSKLTSQHTTTIGGNISGPIVKDKLFFFVNVENMNESYPSSYYPGVYSTYLTTSVAQQIADKYKSITGIDETFGQRDVKHNQLDILARIDWNINANNKLALRYQHSDAYDDKYSAGAYTYYFNNSSYRFNNLTNSFVAELNSNLSQKLYNELRVSYNRVRDNRDVAYQGPLFYIKNISSEDGSKSINANIGTEYSSGANLLDQDIYLLEDNLSWYLGNNTLTIGTHNEFFNMRNLFIQANNGEWVYNSLEAFLNDQPNQFVFKCTDPTLTGGDLLYAPRVKAGQFGFYVQDKYDYSNNLQLTFGLRFDIPVMFNEPTENTTFNEYAAKKGLDVKVGEMPSAKVMLSPRFGFRIYADDTHKTLFRGGVGLFTGRVPFVWMSNAFSNNGVEITGTTINNASDIPAVTGDAQDLVDALNKGTKASPDIVTVDHKFRYPQVLRADLAWEQVLPYDWKFTLEALYSKTFNNAYFQNLALTQSGSVYAVPGVSASAAPYYSVDKSYYSIINTTNSDRGYSYNFSASIEKKFNFGLNLMASYTFGHSKSVYDGTSSVAYSNWKYNYAVDTNDPRLAYSMYDIPHRIMVNVGWVSPRYANGWLQSELGVTYNGYSGTRYSLTMSESYDYNGDGYKGNSLLYLPTDDELDLMQFKATSSLTEDEQRELFRDFLASDSYAKDHRGQYAPRNSNAGKFEHQIDLHFAESIFALKERGSKVMLTVDVLNFANMLNKKWGATWSGTYNVSPLKVVGVKKAADGVYNTTYQWNNYTEPSKANIGSRWHAQVGVKLIF